MRMKEIKLILAALLIVGSIFTIKSFIPKSTEKQQTTIQLENSKVTTNEMVIESIKDLQTIELNQISFNKVVEISTGNKLTKKTQNITFKGRVINKLDLSSCTIEIFSDNIIKIYIKDYEQSVEFFEQDTTYSETENALFSFGDLKVTPAQYEEIKCKIKEQVLNESRDEIQNLNTKASTVISRTLKTLTNQSYDIRIVKVGA